MPGLRLPAHENFTAALEEAQPLGLARHARQRVGMVL